MDDSPVVTPPYLAGPLRLLPFRGMLLAANRIGDPAAARAFARPYRDVARRLRTWERQGLVQHDAAPAVYLHEYTSGGIVVRGLVGALDISHRAATRAARVVYPHEGIHPQQVAELADRMAEMDMNPAPILLVHRGRPELRRLVAAVRGTDPDHEFVDRAGQHHRIWAVHEPDVLRTLDAALHDARALIADGHHRYAAYVRLQDAHPGGAYDLGLAMLVDQDDTPLFLGAIHRVLHGVPLPSLETAAREVGADVERLEPAAALAALAPRTLVATDGTAWSALRLRVARNRAAVEELHDRLLPALAAPAEDVTRHHVAEEALGCARPDATTVLMPAPDFDLVLRIVASGRLLPEKATSFQPKPHVGVLIRSLHDG